MSTLSPNEAAQLAQTIEMFEVITQSQPQDYQSLEILKEAYSKLGREPDVIKTSKRIAEAYVQLGQLSSAILEYETILQRAPHDADVLNALKSIEGRASSFAPTPAAPEPAAPAAEKTEAAAAPPARPGKKAPAAPAAASSVEDGRQIAFKHFVDSKIITAGDFELCWHTPDPLAPPAAVIEPFIQTLADKGVLPIEKSLKLMADKSRVAYLPLDKYDTDLDITRSFPGEACRRWCVLPFDRLSKTILVATANPFNVQAARDLQEATKNRLVWFVASPQDIIKNLQKAFR